MFATKSQARPHLDGEVSSAAHSDSASDSLTIPVVEAEAPFFRIRATRKEVA